MSIKSTLAKAAVLAAFLGVIAFAAMTPNAVRAFFVENPVRNLANAVMQRQPVSLAASQSTSKAQPSSLVSQAAATTLADDTLSTPITGTVELVGTLEAKSGSTWTVSGVTVLLTTTTEFKGVLDIGVLVKVEGLKQADGAILAREIKVYTDDNGGTTLPQIEFVGVLNAKNGSSWTVDTTTVVLSTTTEVKGTLEIGDLVKVEGFPQADGSILAREIKLAEDTEGEHENHGMEVEFEGTLNAKDGMTWTVDTTTVIISTTTEVKGMLEVGDLVKVEGYKQADGSVLAKEIKPADESENEHKNHGSEVELEGTLNAIDGSTWTVDTTTVIISTTTELKGNLEVGVHVKVEGYKQADGSILAKEIKASGPKDGEHEKEGVKVEGELTAMNGSVWTVGGTTVMVDAKTQIKGDPQVGDMVEVAGQYLADGTIVANHIKVSDDKNGDDKGGSDDDDDDGDDKGGGSNDDDDDDDHNKGGGSDDDDDDDDKGGGSDDGGKDKGHNGKND